MISIWSGLILFSVVLGLFSLVVPEEYCWQDKVKNGLSTFFVVWVIYALFYAFYLVGSGLNEVIT